MKNLIIIGAGGYGREAFTLAKNSIGYNKDFVVKGYLDSNLKALDKLKKYPPVLSTIEQYIVLPDDVFICAIGDVKLRKKTVREILIKGGIFTNLIHKSVYLGDNVVLGKGVFIAYDVVISNDTIIEDYVLINSRALIGHDCKVNSYCSVGVYSFIGGGVLLGKESAVHANASIRNNISIGVNASVGMGSVVIKNVEAHSNCLWKSSKENILENVFHIQYN